MDCDGHTLTSTQRSGRFAYGSPPTLGLRREHGGGWRTGREALALDEMPSGPRIRPHMGGSGDFQRGTISSLLPGVWPPTRTVTAMASRGEGHLRIDIAVSSAAPALWTASEESGGPRYLIRWQQLGR